MQILSLVLASALVVAPVFAVPNGSWVQQPPDPRHTNITKWELQPGQDLLLSVTPFSGKTEDWRSSLEKAFTSGRVPLRIESEGTVKICNGLVADRLTVLSSFGIPTHTEHAFIANAGKLYDLSYVYITPQPLAEAQTALASLCPANS